MKLLFIMSSLILFKRCIGNADDAACKNGYVTEDGLCLPYATEYYGKCQEDAQCEWLGANSACLYKVCTCKDGFRWYQGGCRKYARLGGDCTDNLDCFDGYNPLSLSCIDQKCSCSDGYYQRGDADCRKIATKAKDLCALDIDCQFRNGVCVLGKCATSRTSSVLTEEKFLEFDYQEEADNNLGVEATELQTCEKEEDCGTASNKQCFRNMCVCKPGYFSDANNSSCIAEIGIKAGCTSDTQCPLKPGKCIDGTCYCRDYYFTQQDNRKCVKTMSETNWNCVSKEWCYALGPHSYCSSDNICKCSRVATFDKEQEICKQSSDDPDICVFNVQCQSNITNSLCIDETCHCKKNYRYEDDKCLPNIGYPCDNDESRCTITNAECSQSVCQCFPNYISSSDTTCHRMADKLGDSCEIDAQCNSKLSYTKCTSGRCACLENYMENKDNCIQKKEYMSYCTNLVECTFSLGDTFVCRNSKCQCPTGYKYKITHCASSGTRFIVNTITMMMLVGILTKTVLL